MLAAMMLKDRMLSMVPMSPSIIAAVRGNGIGMDQDSHKCWYVIRCVPNENGDKEDKDVANAIRYAVDNGASVINMSFGKGFSPNKDLVDEAVKVCSLQGCASCSCHE
ncbi:MAG: S8 family serine peptidase [Saprospiraceae bacterium]